MTSEELAKIDAAIAAHGQWLSRLRKAVKDGVSEFRPGEVRSDNQCPFGRWIYGGFPAELKGSPLFEEVRHVHAQVHVHAATILELALGGRKPDAERLIAPESDFVRISTSLLAKLAALKSR